MKQFAMILLAISGLAQARQPLNQATSDLLKVTCYKSDGTQEVTVARRVFFNAQENKLIGIGLGLNRQDDGFRVYSGNCGIEIATQDSPDSEE